MRALLSGLALAAALASSASASILIPGRTVITDFRFGGLHGTLEASENLIDPTGQTWEGFVSLPLLDGHDSRLNLWGDLTPVGDDRFTGLFQFGFIEGQVGLGFASFPGLVSLRANGTWTCKGSCELSAYDPATESYLPTGTSLTSGTYGAPAPVPLPASASLLGLAVAAFAALRRRRA